MIRAFDWIVVTQLWNSVWVWYILDSAMQLTISMCWHQLKGAEWHITAWGLFGARPLSKPMLVIFHWTLENKFQWNFNQTITVSYKKMQIKMPFANWWSFCLAINMSTYQHFLDLNATWFMWPDNVWHSIGGLHPDTSGITSASRRLKSPTNRLFVHQFVKSVMAVHLSTLLAFVLESRKSTIYQ